jgi:hypothetical protein
MVMKPHSSSFRLEIAFAAFLASFLVGAARCLDWDDAYAAASEVVVLNAGETRVIDKLSRDVTPTFHVVDNPHALIVHGSDPGKLVLLGAERGKWEISAKRESGEAVSYDVTVKALKNPAQPLKPVEASSAAKSAASAAPVAGSVPAGSSVDSIVGAAPLDSGSGPVASALDSPGSVAAAAPAPPPASSGGTSPATSPPAAAPSPPEQANKNPSIRPISAQTGPGIFRSDPAIASSGESYSSDGVASSGSSGGSHFLPPDALSMMSGTRRIIDFADRLHRVSVGNTDVADVQVFTPYQINLIGHQPGFTTLAVVTSQGHYEERRVRVDPGGKQRVMLNCVVAQLDRGKIENQGVNLSVALRTARP